MAVIEGFEPEKLEVNRRQVAKLGGRHTPTQRGKITKNNCSAAKVVNPREIIVSEPSERECAKYATSYS